MNDILTRIGYNKSKEKIRLERAALLLVMGHVQLKGVEADNLRVYLVKSQTSSRIYKVYVGNDIYPTCTCRDWGLNDWADAYQGIPKPTYRCKHGIACLLKEHYSC